MPSAEPIRQHTTLTYKKNSGKRLPPLSAEPIRQHTTLTNKKNSGRRLPPLFALPLRLYTTLTNHKKFWEKAAPTPWQGRSAYTLRSQIKHLPGKKGNLSS